MSIHVNYKCFFIGHTWKWINITVPQNSIESLNVLMNKHSMKYAESNFKLSIKQINEPLYGSFYAFSVSPL